MSGTAVAPERPAPAGRTATVRAGCDAGGRGGRAARRLHALSLLMSPKGYLGTDTGGKVATLEVMAHHGGGLDPDLGYWAARWDPRRRCTASTTRTR